MPEQQKHYFDVHPSVVYQLGESLITDSVQALIELVKNCYDADATYAKVTIDTQGAVNVQESLYSSEKGRIIVEDDGCGMDLETIKSCWLMISNRKKLELKQSRKTTAGGRTPLGDKGLGRLGTQRLGESLEVFTKYARGQGYHFGFSWLDFATAPTLKDVDIHLDEIKYSSAHGTKVVISDLKEIEIWKGQSAIKRLEQELSRMISPYKKIRNFTVYINIDGKTLDLLEISDKVRELAPVHYDITFSGNELEVTGQARLDFFRPSTSSEETELFDLIVESDGGKAFYDFLQESNVLKAMHLTKLKQKNWFVEFKLEKNLVDMDKIEHEVLHDDVIANPGQFFGEVDSFNLGQEFFKQQSVFDRAAEYREAIRELSGVRVYRDGFAIRVDRDWLKLGAQWTSARSYYGLKPDNTLGYIALSARDNINLEETTDREGFKDTEYYRNFYRILSEFTKFTTDAHNALRRAWVEFKKKRHEEIARTDSRKSVEDMSHAIKAGLENATEHQKNLIAFQDKLEITVNKSQSIVSELASVKEVTAGIREKIKDSLSDLKMLLNESSKVIQQVSSYLEQVTNLRDVGQVLEDRVDNFRRQMDEMYETTALGLTAEALSHEVFNIADQLAKRTKNLQTYLKNSNVSDHTTLVFIEYVQSAITALRKQMSFLSPALRYVREKKEDIDIFTFLSELSAFYSDRLAQNYITMEIRKISSDSFTIRMNKGKLIQIFDNFIFNSEYWLKEDLSQRRITKGTIIFEIKRPFINIFDNGRGIEPSIESAIFEPFVSAKEKGLGRGLGLFIVKQLLDSESCSVRLLPERNKQHRFFQFQVDLRGAINE